MIMTLITGYTIGIKKVVGFNLENGVWFIVVLSKLDNKKHQYLITQIKYIIDD